MNSEKDKILLSILIPTLGRRQLYFRRITRKIYSQIKELGLEKQVEILSYNDNGERTTGFKRNVLLQRANGLFTVFVDDDDMVADFYIREIIEAIKNNPDIDCIGIQGKYSEDRGAYKPFETSLKHNWEQKDGWYCRTINHISPIRRELAVQVLFPDKTRFEDYEWTMALKKTGLLKKEVVIEKPMYYYDFISNKQY